MDRHRKGPAREQLLALRRAYVKAQKSDAQWFADQLGICRVHMLNVETGRRDPSIPLVLRWMRLLPGATLDMFEPIPSLDELVAQVWELRQVAPGLFDPVR